MCQAVRGSPALGHRRSAIGALLSTRDGNPITVSSDPGLRFRAGDAITDLAKELAVDRPMGSATWRMFRAAVGSVEGRLAVPAPLELEEAIRLGHQRHPVPQPPGRLAARCGRDDGTEDGVSADADDRRADV